MNLDNTTVTQCKYYMREKTTVLARGDNTVIVLRQHCYLVSTTLLSHADNTVVLKPEKNWLKNGKWWLIFG